MDNAALETAHEDNAGFDAFLSKEPTPDVLAAVQEEYEFLLSLLRDDALRKIANHRLAGLTNSDIARANGVSLRTVERKIALIQATWETRVQ